MKPIYLSDALKKDLIETFASKLEKVKLADGKFSFTQAFEYPEDTDKKNTPKVFVDFTASAWSKMTMLVQGFDSEVAWNGLVKRVSDTHFLVYDILTFKQKVTSVTVDTDEEEYLNFLMNLSDEQAQDLLFHGHSHVNMATSPSATDIDHRAETIANAPKDKFYIFMIWNKSFSVSSAVYDFANNILYEGKEVVWDVLDDNGNSIREFLADANKMVTVEKAATYNGSYSSGYTSGGYYSSGSAYGSYGYGTSKSSTSLATTDKKDKKKDESKRANYSSWDDDDDEDAYLYAQGYKTF